MREPETNKKLQGSGAFFGNAGQPALAKSGRRARVHSKM
jgi:hypothetical protein